jgi:hypothetical protein
LLKSSIVAFLRRARLATMRHHRSCGASGIGATISARDAAALGPCASQRLGYLASETTFHRIGP